MNLASQPCPIRIDARDNVAIVANDGGLVAGTRADDLLLTEALPQGRKGALIPIAAGAPVLRYNVVIGYAAQDIPAGAGDLTDRLAEDCFAALAITQSPVIASVATKQSRRPGTVVNMRPR